MAFREADRTKASLVADRNATEDVPYKVWNATEDVPYKVWNATEDVPYKVWNATEDVPYKVRNATEDVPYKDRNATEDVPYTVECQHGLIGPIHPSLSFSAGRLGLTFGIPASWLQPIMHFVNYFLIFHGALV